MKYRRHFWSDFLFLGCSRVEESSREQWLLSRERRSQEQEEPEQAPLGRGKRRRDRSDSRAAQLSQVALPAQEVAVQPVASGEVDEKQAVEVVQEVVATIDLAQANVPAPALEAAPASSITE
ncbi:MAG: hypothetical protein SGPRY_009029, partial [Prymnesium sp.]